MLIRRIAMALTDASYSAAMGSPRQSHTTKPGQFTAKSGRLFFLGRAIQPSASATATCSEGMGSHRAWARATRQATRASKASSLASNHDQPPSEGILQLGHYPALRRFYRAGPAPRACAPDDPGQLGGLDLLATAHALTRNRVRMTATGRSRPDRSSLGWAAEGILSAHQ